MPRAIWSGAISFGLINIPIKLYSAVKKRDIGFHELHGADGARLQHKRICPVDGEEVSYENIVKGYEIAPGQHVIVKKEELNALEPKARRTVDIKEFVSLDQIDPIYYQRPYYLLPDKTAEKAYTLFVQALEESQQVAIASFVMRTKEYLAALRPIGNVLNLSTMLHADEIVSSQQLDGVPRKVDIDQKELKMARQLIDSLVSDFKPEQYEDRYRQKVMELIESKAAGKEISAEPEQAAPAEVIDISAALEKSLAEVKKNRKKSA